jgi:hypothetical protein
MRRSGIPPQAAANRGRENPPDYQDPPSRSASFLAPKRVSEGVPPPRLPAEGKVPADSEAPPLCSYGSISRELPAPWRDYEGSDWWTEIPFIAMIAA